MVIMFFFFSHGAYEIPRIAENYPVEKESAVRCTIIAMARKGRPSTMGEDAPIRMELNCLSRVPSVYSNSSVLQIAQCMTGRKLLFSTWDELEDALSSAIASA